MSQNFKENGLKILIVATLFVHALIKYTGVPDVDNINLGDAAFHLFAMYIIIVRGFNSQP